MAVAGPHLDNYRCNVCCLVLYFLCDGKVRPHLVASAFFPLVSLFESLDVLCYADHCLYVVSGYYCSGVSAPIVNPVLG